MSTVAAPPTSVQFVAKRSDLWLIHTPAFTKYGPSGNVIGKTQSVMFEFSHGTIRFSPQDFEQGGRYFKTGLSFAEALDWFRNHNLFADRNDGFWEVTQEAPEISGDEFSAILSAAQAGDRELLEQIQADELAGWNRPKLLEAVDQAITNLPKAQMTPEVVSVEQPVKRGPGRPPKNPA